MQYGEDARAVPHILLDAAIEFLQLQLPASRWHSLGNLLADGRSWRSRSYCCS